MRCLLIAPASVDVQVLSGVLGDQGVEVLQASDLGAGVTLAQAAIDHVDFAVAVLPRESTGNTADGLTAIFIEIGIVAGREVPILVIVEPPQEPPPALAGTTILRAPVDHVDALRLHIRMFKLSVASGCSPQQPDPPAALAPSSIADFRARIEAIRNPPQDHGAYHGPSQLLHLIYDLLSRAGAVLATSVQMSPRREADAVAYVPGTEGILGAIVVEIKLRRLTEGDLQRAEQGLLTSMRAGLSRFGLLIYADRATDVHTVRASPFILALSIDELLTELEHVPLGTLLVRARNRAVHGA